MVTQKKRSSGAPWTTKNTECNIGCGSSPLPTQDNHHRKWTRWMEGSTNLNEHVVGLEVNESESPQWDSSEGHHFHASVTHPRGCSRRKREEPSGKRQRKAPQRRRQERRRERFSLHYGLTMQQEVVPCDEHKRRHLLSVSKNTPRLHVCIGHGDSKRYNDCGCPTARPTPSFLPTPTLY